MQNNRPKRTYLLLTSILATTALITLMACSSNEPDQIEYEYPTTTTEYYEQEDGTPDVHVQELKGYDISTHMGFTEDDYLDYVGLVVNDDIVFFITWDSDDQAQYLTIEKSNSTFSHTQIREQNEQTTTVVLFSGNKEAIQITFGISDNGEFLWEVGINKEVADRYKTKT